MTAVSENNISKTFLAKYVKERGMERIARGVYITEDVWPDELYIMQARNKAAIFSGETALYLHGLIDREYSAICISVPTGYNATHLKTENVYVQGYVTMFLLSCRYLATGGGVHMEIAITVLVTVAAGVVCHLVCKWLDGNDKDNK